MSAYPHIKDYSYINLSVDTNLQIITIDGESVVNSGVKEALGKAFMNPHHEHFYDNGGGLKYGPSGFW